MKQVVIVRHGKAVPYGYEDDFTRDLRERGKSDAKLVSEELKKRGIIPDKIISSPAKRAFKTAMIFAENLDYSEQDIITVEDIYDGLTTNDFLELIKAQPSDVNKVFFFGHNPGFYYYVCNLLEEFYSDMPTTSTVGINFDVKSWEEVEARNGKLAFHLVPRMFK
ncbi:histidine phosphatase family protein [Draconibacterium sp. IB214405]|uniref:SixA phosphatase family protein n=1 Tax=Draconibacterium sp. IB214405 TaxID=3097352 RepID=UPI002A0B4BE8|nr:histidine phosphatase family protein [Draconibacterium sp. IB214405]MDX8340012.1 histidine phosphatase family protein [Draconibacterium sp. IB214405]